MSKGGEKERDTEIEREAGFKLIQSRAQSQPKQGSSLADARLELMNYEIMCRLVSWLNIVCEIHPPSGNFF